MPVGYTHAVTLNSILIVSTQLRLGQSFANLRLDSGLVIRFRATLRGHCSSSNAFGLDKLLRLVVLAVNLPKPHSKPYIVHLLQFIHQRTS